METEVYIPPVEPQLTIKFKSRSEAKELLDAIRTWTAHDEGLVKQLILALQETVNGNH